MLRQALAGAAAVTEALLSPLGDACRDVGQARVLHETGHRPWPLPSSPWLMAQSWNDLLFAHWPVPAERLQSVVPAEVQVDTFDGSAWIGITPFEVSGLRLRGAPPAPGISRFPELNVRTYTRVAGKPGIWFMSLDADSSFAVVAARRTYRLPYFRARMSTDRSEGGIHYRSKRSSPDGEPAELRAMYRPTGPVFQARPGSLEHFLVERYCLYGLDERRRICRADIHHPPWPLQPAEASLERNTMTAPYRIELPPEPPLLHFAGRQDVVIWSLTPLA